MCYHYGTEPVARTDTYVGSRGDNRGNYRGGENMAGEGLRFATCLLWQYRILLILIVPGYVITINNNTITTGIPIHSVTMSDCQVPGTAVPGMRCQIS